MSNKHQANAQANGWNFEYAAALFLFLEYSKTIKAIGLEKDEDIILLKNNGHYIVAQAKSSLENKKIYEESHYPEIKKSLLSLSDVKLENIDKYVAINNFRDPFGKDSYIKFINDEKQEYKFVEFPDTVIDKLNEYCSSANINLDLNKVFYQFVQFQGEKPGEYIKKVLKSKLVLINNSAESKADIIYNKFISLFENNAREKEKNVDKGIILGSLYSILLSGIISIESVAEYAGIEIGMQEFGTENEINSFFNDSSLSLNVYSSIMGDYLTYLERNNLLKRDSESLSQYIKTLDNMALPEYFSEYFLGRDYDVKKMFKLFVAFVCVRNNIIDKINEVFSDEND